jgi:hypothetical protein
MVVGKAQEKAPVFRAEKRRNSQTGRTYHLILITIAMVNNLLDSVSVFVEKLGEKKTPVEASRARSSKSRSRRS